MKRFNRRHFSHAGLFLLGTALLFAAPAKSKSGSNSKNAPNFQRTKTRIEALLGPRTKQDPLPENIPNPFVIAEAPPPTNDNDPKPVEKLPVSSDGEMLLYYGAALKISGVVRLNEQTHLVINQNPYKEGDTINLKTKEGTVKLRVIGIAPGELTLGLNEAIQIVKFKK